MFKLNQAIMARSPLNRIADMLPDPVPWSGFSLGMYPVRVSGMKGPHDLHKIFARKLRC